MNARPRRVDAWAVVGPEGGRCIPFATIGQALRFCRLEGLAWCWLHRESGIIVRHSLLPTHQRPTNWKGF